MTCLEVVKVAFFVLCLKNCTAKNTSCPSIVLDHFDNNLQNIERISLQNERTFVEIESICVVIESNLRQIKSNCLKKMVFQLVINNV